MNKQKFFEDIKVVLICSIIGLVTFGFSSSLFTGFFVGIFILWFYFSYEKFFILKDAQQFAEKINSIVGFSIGLLGISGIIAWMATALINGKIILF